MRVRLSDQAKTDIAAANKYYRAIGGPSLAKKMLARIKGPTLALGDRPEIAPAYGLAEGVRRLVVADGAFLVFYRVAVVVEVLHIRRAEREPVLDQTLREMIDEGRM